MSLDSWKRLVTAVPYGRFGIRSPELTLGRQEAKVPGRWKGSMQVQQACAALVRGSLRPSMRRRVSSTESRDLTTAVRYLSRSILPFQKHGAANICKFPCLDRVHDGLAKCSALGEVVRMYTRASLLPLASLLALASCLFEISQSWCEITQYLLRTR